jgi:imidazolonepropionase-like amidohydrolase
MQAKLCMLLLAGCLGRAEDLAFVHVNVIPMDRDHALADQTVLVTGDRVSKIGPAAEVLIGAGTRRIDGSGAFLIPGLSDMHMHFALPAVDPESYESLNEKFALQMVASGITTVRNMRGFPELLQLRAAIASGAVIGPQIYSTGPGNNAGSAIWPYDRRIETAEEAQDAVTQDKANGFDAIKIYSGLSAIAYRHLVRAARNAGLPVYGHVPYAVGLRDVLNAKQDSIEHLSGYLEAIQPYEAQVRMLPVLRHFDGHYNAATLRSVAEATRQAGTWNCPTLIWLRSFYARWHSIPATLGPWRTTDPPPLAWQDDRFPLVVVEALHAAGARLLVGTDADGAYVVHGDSIHVELELFVSAGFTPYEALRASTADAAEFLGKQSDFGTIAAGKLANLVLLAGDPRVDIGNTRRRIGVMVGGHWFTQRELQRLSDAPGLVAQNRERQRPGRIGAKW